MIHRQIKARSFSQRFHFHKLLVRIVDPNWIPQRPAEAFEGNRHHVTIFESQWILEAKHVRAEKVNMYVARTAVFGVFEVMMFQVGDRMAHPLLAGRLGGLPDDFSAALDGGLARYVVELRIEDKLWPERAIPQF